MKVLITGSNGLLGQKLVNLLGTKPDVEVIATSSGENRLPKNSVSNTFHSLDITDKKQVNEVMEKFGPDMVVNTAAMTNVDQCESDRQGCWDLNVHAVENLVESCAKQQSFLLHLSTDFIFDGEDGPYLEDSKPNPISYYGESKLASEKVVMESSIDWAIARTILVYGISHQMSRSNIILWVKDSLENEKQIRVVNDQWRTPTLAEDLAQGCYLIIKHRAHGIFNISGKDLLSPYQMATKTADYFNLDKGLITETDSQQFTQPAKRPPKTGFIIDKAQDLLGYDPHSFEEGIAILAKRLKQKV